MPVGSNLADDKLLGDDDELGGGAARVCGVFAPGVARGWWGRGSNSRRFVGEVAGQVGLAHALDGRSSVRRVSRLVGNSNARSGASGEESCSSWAWLGKGVGASCWVVREENGSGLCC